MAKAKPCAVPECSSPATDSRDRLIHEASSGTVRKVTWDVCDEHAAQFDADPDAFVRHMTAG